MYVVIMIILARVGLYWIVFVVVGIVPQWHVSCVYSYPSASIMYTTLYCQCHSDVCSVRMQPVYNYSINDCSNILDVCHHRHASTLHSWPVVSLVYCTEPR